MVGKELSMNKYLKFHYENTSCKYDSLFYDLKYFFLANNRRETFKKKMCEFLGINSEQLFLTASGRSGLNLILKSFGIGDGDEVIVLPFTCEAVIDAVMETEAIPIYADVDLDSLSFNVDDVVKKISKKTKAIILQYSFIPNNLVEELRNILPSHVRIIEDCALVFGSQNKKGEFLGTIGDASFYSFDKTKIFSTIIGGACYFNSKDKLKSANIIYNKAGNLSLPFIISVVINRYLLAIVVKEKLYKLLIKILSAINRLNLLKDFDMTFSPRKSQNYIKKISSLQCHWGVRQLRFINDNLNSRIYLKNKIIEIMNRRNINYPKGLLENGCYPLRIPVLVTNRDALSRSPIDIGDWFVSFALGYEGMSENLHYNPSCFERSQIAQQQIINLPTLLIDSKLNETYLKEVDKLLSEIKQV